ncbi:phytase [Spirilliplanes yamanashiensis]|uniref:Hydrolase n=1 Tax=Spirilliplanes yamanashiensis TaxID=42233 RepID=A0A8J3Y6D6_9ACTN|nr:phytase [Spirilliplanes yamanashiensis]MDP9814577.1 3-phytase [Spirilliplanes yamanashiensis]GIJ02229.1 hydrolase [Spirilliplanes yamanashiensis]
MRRLTVLLAVPLLLVTATPAVAAGGRITEVTARVETPALYDDEAGGDADADDPAIWVHPGDRRRSRVLATAKNGGLRVYDLAGRETQAVAVPPGGRFNNVDLAGDLAVVTDRGRDQLRFYRIDRATSRLADVTAAGVPFAFSADEAEVALQRTAYGLGLWRDGRRLYAVVSRRSTPEVGIFEILDRGRAVTYRKVDGLTLPATFRLPDGTAWAPCADPGDGPQVEGTVVDAARGVAYLAQEDVGLWRVPVARGRFAGRPASVERVREFGVPAAYDEATEECVVDHSRDPGFGGRIAADVEGLTIARNTLVVSSQGDDTFYTYDRRSNRPLGRFAVVAGARADGSQECDGAAVTATPLPGFPGGLLVVHDGRETPDGDRPATNFEFVDAGFLWRA